MSTRMFVPFLFLSLLAASSLGWVSGKLKSEHYGLVEEHDLPQSLAAGASYQATWSMDIHQTAGFARFQIQFPAGIQVSPSQLEGASFTFQDGKAKFIWTELPPQRTLELQLNMSADDTFTGGVITQWFSFIEDGSRKDVEFEPHPLALATEEKGSDTSSLAAQKNEPIQNDPKDIVIKRSWNSKGPSSGVMAIEITGFESGQFLKITEILGGLTIVPLEDGASHIRDLFDNQLVYIWHTTPDVPMLRVSYEVAALDPSVITGTLATILHGEAVEHPIAPTETITSPPAVREPNASDIAFRLQVLATHQPLSGSQVQRTYAYPGEVKREKHQGWNKYTTGYFTAYKAARDKRVELRSSYLFPGPFVAAYNGQRRITVQEALLISQQNWIR